MKKLILGFLLINVLSCSSYNVKKIIEEDSHLEKFKASGIFLRLSKNSISTSPEINTTISYFLNSYNSINNVKLLNEVDKSISVYNSEFDRFLQLSIENKYMKYKSIGVIRTYLSNNADELKKNISDNGLDSLIIYELNSGISNEMQLFDFNSMIVIVDQELNIVYLDYQSNNYPEESSFKSFFSDATLDYDPILLKKYLYDNISKRLLEKLVDFDFVEKSENEIPEKVKE